MEKFLFDIAENLVYYKTTMQDNSSHCDNFR